jgi:hypothetical protein
MVADLAFEMGSWTGVEMAVSMVAVMAQFSAASSAAQMECQPVEQKEFVKV